MTIDVKYNIGDSIRYIEKISHPVWDLCSCCKGEKYIIGADGEQYECPKCEGNGKIRKENSNVEDEKTGTIKSIHIHYDSDMDSYHGKPNIYYTIPQSVYHIQQEDILGKYNG